MLVVYVAEVSSNADDVLRGWNRRDIDVEEEEEEEEEVEGLCMVKSMGGGRR